MGDPEGRCSNPHAHRPPGATELFAWRGGTIVLLAERVAGRWVVARGWRQGDRLTDVRRWSFVSPRLLAGQVRRLAHEATGDATDARAAGSAALAWAEAAGPAAEAEPPATGLDVEPPPAE